MRVSRALRWTVLALTALVAWNGARAQFEVTAAIEPEQEIHLDQPIEFVIRVAGESNPDVDTPRLPALTNLRVTGGPHRRISSNWVNGKFSARVDLRYDLEAEKVGEAEIPSVDLRVDGKSYRTDPLRFAITEVPSVPLPTATGRSGSRSSRSERDQALLRAEIGAKEIWVGQVVPLSVSLYTEGLIGSALWRSEPQFSNFWVEELKVDSEAEAYTENVGGRRYIVRTLRRKVLIPQSPGQYEIDPWVLQLQVRGGRRNSIDILFPSRGDTIVRRTEPLSLTVNPLPAAGRPDHFGGAVGNYEMRASLDREITAVNEAVALKVTVEGEGFLLTVSPPIFEAPAGVKLFEPEVRSSTEGRDGTLISSKSWEWILVPNTPGEIRLPPMEFHYFDTVAGRYRTARHEFEPLVVRHGDPGTDGPQAGGEIRVLQRDLAFIKPLDEPLRVREPGATERKLFLILLLLPAAWVPLWIVLGRRRDRLRQDAGLARGRKAGRRARRALRSAAKQLRGADSAAFHEAVARALVDYVADRFDRASAGLTYETADDLLASRGLAEPLRRRFRDCLESCDFARFVPDSAAGERREEVLREAETLIDELETAL